MRPIDADYIHEKLTELYKNAQGDARKAYSNALDIVCDGDTVDCEPIINAEWVYLSPLTDTMTCSNCDYNIQSIELVTPITGLHTEMMRRLLKRIFTSGTAKSLA